MNYPMNGIKLKIYPTFCLFCALACGIWWQPVFKGPFLTMVMLVGATVGLITWGILYGIKIHTLALQILYISFFCAGIYRHALVINKQQELYAFINNHPCNIIGTIVDIQHTSTAYLRYAVTVSVNALCLSSDPEHRFKHTFLLRVYTCFGKNLCISDQIFVDQVAFKCHRNNDFAKYLLKDNILASVIITNRPINVIERPNWSCWRAIDHYRSYVLHTFNEDMEGHTYKAFASIFLGNMAAKKEETVIKSELRNWGLFHYIARAGLHLVIFISIWAFLLGLLPIPFAFRQVILIILCTLYFVLSWPSIPFNRAFFTFILIRICTLLRIRTYYIPSLSLIAIGTLMIYPLQLFSLDFQLSFGITYALAWFNEIRTVRA